MKKILAIVLALAVLFSLAGCGVAANQSSAVPDNVDMTGSGDESVEGVTTPTDEPLDKTSSEDESASSNTDSSDITSVGHDCMVRSPQKENKKIEKIVDESEDYVVTAAVWEFFRDDTYIYEFSSGKSIVVYYSDGTKQDFVAALKRGNVKVTDLDKFGIKYMKSSIADRKKEMHIVDLTESGRYSVEDAEEEFYRDDKYIYLFPTQKGQYVLTLFYWDDYHKPVKEALAEGRIDIASVLKELDRAKIEYIKRPISEE